MKARKSAPLHVFPIVMVCLSAIGGKSDHGYLYTAAEFFGLAGLFLTAGIIFLWSRQAAKARREHQQHLVSIYNTVEDVIFHLAIEPNDQFRFVSVNAAFLKVTGLSLEKVVGKTVNEVIPEPSLKVALGRYRQAVQEKTIVRWEETSDYPTGRLTGEVSIAPVCDSKGACTHLVGSVHDITERKRAAEAVRANEERWRSIFENSAVGISLADSRGFFIATNRAYQQLVGYSDEELRSLTYLDITYEEDRARNEAAARYLWEGKLTQFSQEKRYRRKDGTLIWVRITLSMVSDGESSPRFAMAIVEDITERKLAEEALRESEERHRTILRTAIDGFWVADIEGRLLEVNESYCRMSGYSAEELLAMRISDLKPWKTAGEAANTLQMLMAQGEHRFESQHRRKDGSILDVEVSAQYKAAQGGRIVTFLRDVTERKRAEEERNSLQLQLAQAQKIESIGRLAGGIAHDFGNLMSVILLQCESALEELRIGDPITESVRAMQEAARRAVALIRQLMAFSHRQLLETEVLSLNSVVAECETMLRRLIGEDINLVFIPGAGWCLVKADHGQIGQIIMNLAVNSRDAMPQGGKLTIETTSVELEDADVRLNPEAKPGSYVVLAVRDTGVGMNMETQARIFEPFFTTKEVGKGTGLGLSMVYGIVKQGNGFITVHSELGQGAEFRIHLPRVLEKPEPRPAVEAAPTQRGVETILVAEDEPALRDKVCELLRGAGYQVLVGKDVDEVVQIAIDHKGPLDLLLTDVVMPNRSGPQLAQQLQRLRPQMKVLYMSGYPDPRELDSGLGLDVDFVQKPFTKLKLLRRLREVLEGRNLSLPSGS